jgi:hypothetical protein
LWFTLRYTVKFAFAIHSDVLEAGTFIQVWFSTHPFRKPCSQRSQ